MRVPLSRATRRVLLGVAIFAFVGVAIYLWRTGSVTATSMRRWIDAMGPAAPVLFVGAFMVGGLIGLPGTAFMLGARLAFGPWLGGALVYVGGLGSIALPFVAARLLRRQAAEPWQPKHRLAARALAMLDTHPVVAVALLRMFFWFNPPLSYALALTHVRLRDYMLGAAIGVAPVVVVVMAASNWFL